MQAVLALVSQALHQDCRQFSTAFLRATSISLVLAVLALINLASPQMATGLGFASWLMWLNYTGITLAGFSWFAAAITEERERQTLGLLRMTGVNGAAILFGKWLPRIIVILVLLIAQLPLAVLSITMGGVTRHQLFAAVIALMAYAVMMSAIALLWSAVCTTARAACWMVVLCWLGMTALPPLWKSCLPRGALGKLLATEFGVGIPERVHLFWGYIVDTRWLANAVHNMSLLRRLNTIFAIQADEPLIEYQVISNLLIGMLAVVLAWFIFEYVTLYNLEAPVKPPVRLSRAFRRRQKKGKRPQKVGRSWGWALAWKEFNFVGSGWTYFFVKALVYPGIGFIIMSVTSASGTPFKDVWNQMAPELFMTVGGLGALAEIAGMTGRMFGDEIRAKTLSGILILPCSIASIGYQKLAGASLTVLPAACTFLVGASLDESATKGFLLGLFSLGGAVIVVGYLVFLHLSVYLSLHLKVGGVLAAFFACWCLFAIGAQGLRMALTLQTLNIVFIVVGLAICAILQFRIARDVQRKGTV